MCLSGHALCMLARERLVTFTIYTSVQYYFVGRCVAIGGCSCTYSVYPVPQDASKAWKIGNDIHTVACGSLTQLHTCFMRPYQPILRVVDHKYAHM